VLALALIVFLLMQLARAGKLPLVGVTGAGGAPGIASHLPRQGLMTSEVVRGRAGRALHRGVARGGPAD